MKPVILIICDGLGYREATEQNGIALANTPNLDRLWKERPHALLEASGESVGLPPNQMGTSEANHLVIGSGRILFHNLPRINHEITSGNIAKNEAILSAIAHAKREGSALHLVGMMSPGGVHGHTDHMKAILKLAKDSGLTRVNLHLFTDGRDVAPKSALPYLEDLEKAIAEIGIGRIASIGGRYWGMDRDGNEDRIDKHYKAMCGMGKKFTCARDAILAAYEAGVTDEFIEPAVIEEQPGEQACIGSKDAVITLNFRADRARQLARRFADDRSKGLEYVAMTKYSDELDVRVAFPPEEIKETLSEVVSRAGLHQLRITETEKFTHLTYFFNAQRYEPDPGEDRIMIPSDKSVKTYDERPEMRAKEISEGVVKAIEERKHAFIATNLVNCDMVGHTGNAPAILKAVEAVDKAIGRIIEAAERAEADVIITADHGNAEQMFDETTKQPMTAHTLNPVPFILVSPRHTSILRDRGLLSDVAPTILSLMELQKPDAMTGESFV